MSNHFANEVNNIDPDDGNSWSCSACNLPIFATPFVDGGGALLHDQCANLPKILKGCELHPHKPLLLWDNDGNEEITCSKCSQKCGSKLYYCGDEDEDSKCGLVLDVACALPIKILHMSHPHRLLAIRGCHDSSCGVCGVSHKVVSETSYICYVCGFWIHKDCATSPNVIEHEKHHHPLVLYHHIAATFGAQYSTSISVGELFSYEGHQPPQNNMICAICMKNVDARFGVYSCIKCRDSIIHINCATSNHQSFKPMLSRDARFPGLLCLPMTDEHQSIVAHVIEDSTTTTSSSRDANESPSLQTLHRQLIRDESHTFIFHHDMDDGDHIKSHEHHRVCDACLKIINTGTPFYSCSICPNFFVHHYCYRLPPFLSANSAHERGHRFLIYLYHYLRTFSICPHCRCSYFRVFYSCTDCDFSLDVSCARMPGVITHDAHNTAHFLRLSESSGSGRGCDCCGRLLGKLCYECRTCPNFTIHTWCAMLPKTVTHKFDPHPLHLTTTASSSSSSNEMICEICENEIEGKVWYYSCHTCDQSFHIDCIPCLDLLYKIKSVVSDGRLPFFDAPKRLIRGLTLQGHGHDYCCTVADEYDDILPSHKDSFIHST